MKLITNNKKAFFDYEFSEKIEAGIVLTGDEVKSLRAGHASLTGAFATIHQGQLTLLNCHISSYSHAYVKGEELSRRTRVLLVHKKQIIKLVGEISRKGVTLIPLKLYFNDKGKVKVEVGVGKHKKAHEKKEILRERDIKRETQRELRNVRA